MGGLLDPEAWAEAGRRAKGLLAEKYDEAMGILGHPRAVYEGKADPYDPGMALGMAGMAMTGGIGGAPKGAIGSGPIRPQAIAPDGSVDLGWVMRDVEPGALNGFGRDINRLRSRMTDSGDFQEVDVPIGSLIATQKKVNPDYAKAREPKGDGYDLPAVFKIDGKLYVGDGHHRLAAGSEKADTARVRLYDMDAARFGDPNDPRQLSLPLQEPKKKGILAYHGSPHDFDKFSLDKIGTGEGAQAYGHGLYFAENEGVARSYRDALTDRSRAQKILASDIDEFPEALPEGRMYEVQINADPDRFLDWDKPLSAQPEPVREALGKIPWAEDYLKSERLTGGQIVPQTREGTTQLREAGVPGIKYLDAGSRNGDGTAGSRNYVVFDDSLVEIVKKYGIAGLALLPPAVLMANGIDPASIGQEQ
jgi:hypothetical protein